jgi:hypothetical protein
MQNANKEVSRHRGRGLSILAACHIREPGDFPSMQNASNDTISTEFHIFNLLFR